MAQSLLFQSETSPVSTRETTPNVDDLDVFLKQHNLEDTRTQLDASGISTIEDLLELKTDQDAQQCADYDLSLSEEHEKRNRFIQAVSDLRAIRTRDTDNHQTHLDPAINEKQKYIIQQFESFHQALNNRQQFLLSKLDEIYKSNKDNAHVSCAEVHIEESKILKPIANIGNIVRSNIDTNENQASFVDNGINAAEPIGLSHTKQIISIQIGQCGNRIGNQFWNNLYQEHISNGKYMDENRKLDVYFKEISESVYAPRAIAIDLDPSTKVTSFIPHTNTVFGTRSARSNFACGHYTDGKEIADKIKSAIRYQLESCDHVAGVQIFHSLNGGTGSGTGSLIVNDYSPMIDSKTTISTYSVINTPNRYHLAMNNNTLEAYNVLLGLGHIIMSPQTYSYVLSNNGILDQLKASLNVSNANFKDINNVYSAFINDVASMFIYDNASLNLSLESVKQHLVPKDNLKLLSMAYVPLFSNDYEQRLKGNEDITTLAKQVWNPQYICMPQDSMDTDRKALSSLVVCRHSADERKRSLNADEINKLIGQQNTDKIRSICNVVPYSNKYVSNSCTNIVNTPWINTLLWSVSNNCMKLFKKRHYMHHLSGEGMDEMEIQEADEKIKIAIDAMDALFIDEDDDEDENDDDEEDD